ncbi:putative DYW domain-containing protein [Helianthus annuus]|nr:putative DYW domain-containing protein [Helianthus annuus]
MWQMMKITLCRMRLIKCGVRLVKEIKEIGYVPDMSHVLLYVDEQEREVKLQYHSEKLALAFALLKTPPGSTIRIKKNIRVRGGNRVGLMGWRDDGLRVGGLVG